MEYRLSWCATSNATFRGRTDWTEWEGPEEAEEEVYEALERGETPWGLSEVLYACGFEWGLEVRP